MVNRSFPRVPNCDLEKLRGIVATWDELIPKTLKLMADDPSNLRQTRASGLAEGYMGIGLCKYGMGDPHADVQNAFLNATSAFEMVFELRGTDPSFPAISVTLDARFPSNDARSLVSKQHLFPPGTADYSLANSKRNLKAVSLALTNGEFERATRIASMAWDPPGASYIGQRSETCRPTDQQLAYSVKRLLAGQEEEAIAEISNLRTNERDVRPREQAAMIRAIVNREKAPFLHSLSRLLAWHQDCNFKMWPHEFNSSVEKIICIWGAGLSALAVRREVLAFDDLPTDNAHLPLDLLQFTLA